MLWVPQLVPLRKHFETLSKQNHGTLWEHSLWEHMFTNPRLVYWNNKTQKYKRNSLPKFFLYDLAVSKLYAQCVWHVAMLDGDCKKGCNRIGCCHRVWSPLEANFSNQCHMENLVTLSLSLRMRKLNALECYFQQIILSLHPNGKK